MPDPHPVAARALQVALSKLGQKEVGGPNQGPIVQWSIKPWTSRPPGPGSWARWCAGFVSTCYLGAFGELPRGLLHTDPAIRWQGLGSLSCDRLWQHLASASCGVDPAAQLLPGDLVFYGQWEDLTHVGIVEVDDGATLSVIEGNARDAVRRVSRRRAEVVRAARPALLLQDGAVPGAAAAPAGEADR